MKLIFVVSVVLVASMIVPQASAYYLRCSTFDRYKNDVNYWFRQRDARINSATSYVAAVNRKVCAIYSIVTNFNSAHYKMEALIKKQAAINARLYSEVSYLYKENKELENMLARMKQSVAAAQRKNNEQDSQLGSLRSHNSKQDSRLSAQERVNSDQQNQIHAIRDVNSAQEIRLNTVRDTNNKQEDSLNMLRSKNGKQDSSIDAAVAKNNGQDNIIRSEIGRNTAQDAVLRKISEVNAAQEKKIKNIQSAIDNIRQITIDLVNKLLAEFSAKMNKSVFAKDMFLVMLNTYI